MIDTSECVWCDQIVILVESTRGILLTRPKWIHKDTGDLHCANGKSAAYPKREGEYCGG